MARKAKVMVTYFLLFVVCFVFSGCKKADADVYLEYLNTLERRDNVCVYDYLWTNYIYFTDGAVASDSLTDEFGKDAFNVITASDEYIFINTLSNPSNIYKTKRDLSEKEKIASIPSYSDYSLNGHTLYYTEDDGKHYIRDLLTDEVTYVGDDDSYYNAHIEKEKKYTVAKGGWFSDYFRVKNVETDKYIDIDIDRFKAVKEINGSALEKDLHIKRYYVYYNNDIYFCLTTALMKEDLVAYYGAALIFKYEPETDTLSYYSWIDTSVNGGFEELRLVIF